MSLYWKLYNKKLKEVLNKKTLQTTNPGTVQAVLILIPYLIITTSIELFIRRITHKKRRKSNHL